MQKEIFNNGWKLVIETKGGRIVNLDKDGQNILGTFERIDGKQGNTHVCVPNFGEEGMEEYGLPFHGPSRNEEWNLIEQTDKKIRINFKFEGTEKYLGKLLIEQEFDLEDGFRQKIRVENIGEKDVPVNLAIHNYWNAKNGWQGLKINESDVSKIVKNDDYFEVKNQNIILFPDGRKMRLDLDGFTSVRLWTGRNDGQYDQSYVCIEPVIGGEGYFGNERSILKVGEVKEANQRIVVE
jgi:galactose mutarotase-like enzyme